MIEIREKPRKVERAWLAGAHYPGKSRTEAKALLDELSELVKNLQIGVAGKELVNLKTPRPRFLIGAGKAGEVIRRAKEAGCDCIVLDEEISPAQQRNWENESGLCVIDRQEVILDIFSDRARTREAVLQTELARMEYSLPRLRRAWTHLNRQRGGRVTLRGEGEAQIELDQRMVRQRIARLKKELAAVVKQRAVQRQQRLRVPVPAAAIVGYTNAGKSSLLNALTRAGAPVADKLFATLDPSTRRMVLPSGLALLLTDTVGFLRRLPHALIESFKATLEEALVSDLLIHVLDASSPEAERHRETTLQVLEELGARGKPLIAVYNKIDRLSAEERRSLRVNGSARPCFISARTGEGLDALTLRLEDFLKSCQPLTGPMDFLIPHDRYGFVHQLHEAGGVLREKAEDEGVRVRARLPRRLLGAFSPFIMTPRRAGGGTLPDE